ncbi:MAG: amidohydrolase [Bacteroidales bacterium]|nr:amidohydrolase [Bacteroidales bacterium]
MYYNCHIHIFKDTDVPNRFLPLALVNILRSTVGYGVITKILKNIIPFTDKDMFDRYVKFITTGKLGSQQKIFEKCRDFYPDDTKFIVLPMDMAYMHAGKVPRPYKQQLEELYNVSQTYPQVIPFVHVDPRREGILDLLKECVEDWNFKGVKLYPPLGYFPYDPDLDPIYEYCQEKNLPLLTHCSPFNPVHFKGRKRDLKKLLEKSIDHIDTRKKSKKELCSRFTYPGNFKHVVKKFPKLRICFGHFGSQYYWDKFIHHPGEKDNWMRVIRDMCIKYDNFYTDISFTMADMKYFSLLKVLLADQKLRKKILFGSDYYMVEVESNERRFGLDLRAYLGEDYFNSIAIENPKVFLG